MGGCQQKLPTFKYDVPAHWVKKYGLNENGNHFSVGGTNRITIGGDQLWLFPKVCETSEPLGVQISQSSITGKYILHGRAVDSDDNINFQHKAVMALGSGTQSTNVHKPFRQSGLSACQELIDDRQSGLGALQPELIGSCQPQLIDDYPQEVK